MLKKTKNTSYGIQTALSRPSKSFSSGFLRQPRVSCAGSHKSEHDCDTIIRRPLKHKCYAIKFYTGGPGRSATRFFFSFFLSPSLLARMISIWVPLLARVQTRNTCSPGCFNLTGEGRNKRSGWTVWGRWRRQQKPAATFGKTKNMRRGGGSF